MSPTTTPMASNPNAANITYLSSYLLEGRPGPRVLVWPRESPTLTAWSARCSVGSGFKRRPRTRSVHLFDPLSAGRPRLERIAEVLRFADHLAGLEFHDADHVRRLSVVRHHQFADPQVSAAEHASHGEALEVRLGGARRLDVRSASDALARLRILENRISSIDLVFRGEVVRVGGIPVALYSRPHVVIPHG